MTFEHVIPFPEDAESDARIEAWLKKCWDNRAHPLGDADFTRTVSLIEQGLSLPSQGLAPDSDIRALRPCVAASHVIGRLLDLSHISWRTCVADQFVRSHGSHLDLSHPVSGDKVTMLRQTV
jgi:hypothetical protein